jgi:hypothetical protein
MTNARSGSTSPAGAARTLAIIRIALLAGVLAFGAVVWYLRRSGGASYDVDPRGLRLAGQAIWGVATFGTLIVFLAADRVPAARRPALSLIAWALGESTALYGGLFWLMLGDPQWYLYGVACLLLTYFIFPVRANRGSR